MSIDSMIDEPLDMLVDRCIRAKRHLQDVERLKCPEFMQIFARKRLGEIRAALRAKIGGVQDDPLEEIALLNLIKMAMDRKQK